MVETSSGVHMKIDRKEILIQSFYNVEVSPIGLVMNVSSLVMDFHDYLVNILEVLSWKGAQA